MADLSSLEIVVAGFGGVGVLAGTTIIVGWLRLLLDLSGRGVRVLTTGVAAYLVATLLLTQYLPEAALAAFGIYLTCAVAASADAFSHQQSKE